jgi:hypothetical protein
MVGDTLVGLDGPKVATAPVASGPPTRWADLESGVPGAIAAFPAGAAIGSAGRTRTTTTSAPAKTAGQPATSTSASAPTTTSATGDTAAPGLPPTAPDGTATGDVVALPTSNSGTSGRPLLAGGAAAGLLAAGLAGLIRRRRALKLP